MKKLLIAASITALLFTLTSCNNARRTGRAPGVLKAGQGPILDTGPGGPCHGAPGQKTEFKICCTAGSQQITGSGVQIEVEDKLENKKEEINAQHRRSEFTIPGFRADRKSRPFPAGFQDECPDHYLCIERAQQSCCRALQSMNVRKNFFHRQENGAGSMPTFLTIHSFTHERYALVLKAATKKEEAPSPH